MILRFTLSMHKQVASYGATLLEVISFPSQQSQMVWFILVRVVKQCTLCNSPASAHPTRGKNCAICYNESGNFSSQAIWSARQNHVGRLTTRPSLFVFHRSLQGDQPCRSHVSPPTLLARPGPGVLATQGSTTIARTAYGALCSCVTIAQSSAVPKNSVSF